MGKYIPKGYKEALKILSNTDKILVYYDPDIDGLFAGYLMTKFLKDRGIESKYYINENRTHGFAIEDIEKLKGYTIIAVDFSIPNINELVQAGIDVINIDHHEISANGLVTCYRDKTLAGVVINNQYEFEPNEWRFLSGAGVVYYTLCMWDKSFESKLHEAIVGITLLSDVRPIENVLARNMLTTTYTSKEPFMMYLRDITKGPTAYGFGVQNMDRNFIDYSFSPKFNSLFRFNEGDRAVTSLLDYTGFSIDLDAYRNNQKKLVEKLLYKSKLLYENEVIFLGLNIKDTEQFINEYKTQFNSEFKISNFIGIMCSDVLKNRHKTTVVLLHDGEGNLIRGSLRGKVDSVDYLKIFRDNGVESAGHKPAFGILCKDLNTIDMPLISKQIGVLESVEKDTKDIIKVTNMALFNKFNAKKVATRNMYVRTPFMSLVEYVGKDIKKKEAEKYVDYYVDGVVIRGFNKEYNFKNAYIIPTLESNYVAYYLTEPK